LGWQWCLPREQEGMKGTNASGGKGALCKWLWRKLRMNFSAGCLECRPAEASRCYEFRPETYDVLSETFEQRDALSFQNEYSDDL
jgi:hypothetical protein